MKCESININKYDVYVFDVDGTLYYQNRLRIEMAKRLLMFCIKNPFKILDLMIIKQFRSLRENSDTTEGIYRELAIKYKKSEEYIKQLISYWIYDNPLSAIEKTKDIEILNVINKLKNNNKKIVIWSDYEAIEKLRVLNIEADGVYTADDERINELKPSPKALELIKTDFNASVDRILMIGDRDCKDGEAARKALVDYVILPKDKKGRLICYNF